jgi:drug/metabolite transporter (DMT)-like permease
MWVVFALVAMALTSVLPICNKRLLRDTPPALVAWAINGASIPLLAGGMLLYTQCSFQDFPHTALSCTLSLPQIDPVFVAALLGAAAFNWGATLLSTHALDRADASLVTPLLTFNPAFTVLVAWIVLGETPGLRESLGIVIILLGVYLLEVQDARTGLLAPLIILGNRSGAVMAILASGLWGTTTVLEKLAIEHVMPPNGPLVALISTALTVLLLTPNAIFALSRSSRTASPEAVETLGQKKRIGGLRAQLRTFLVAVTIAGIAPLFGFTAIALGFVGYVTALFKLSAVFTIVWAWLLLGEGHLRERMLGASVMVLGGALVAT